MHHCFHTHLAVIRDSSGCLLGLASVILAVDTGDALWLCGILALGLHELHATGNVPMCSRMQVSTQRTHVQVVPERAEGLTDHHLVNQKLLLCAMDESMNG